MVLVVKLRSKDFLLKIQLEKLGFVSLKLMKFKITSY
jgi:hypothetical protein